MNNPGRNHIKGWMDLVPHPMDLQQGKEKFIDTWGRLAGSWGVTRTMAQIHALLLIATRPLCAEEIMEDLDISRGSAHMNLKELMDWGLVTRASQEGERREFFIAEKDVWEVFRLIAVQRKKREFEPVIHALDDLADVSAGCPDSEAFQKMIRDLKFFSCKADAMIDKLISRDAAWVINGLTRLSR